MNIIGWDGEGANLHGPNRPQSTVLFGASTGDFLIDAGKHIRTADVLNLISEVSLANPNARHVAYAFNYDVNMILQKLDENKLRELHKTNQLWLNYGEYRYQLKHFPRKIFEVTRLPRKGFRSTPVTTTIFDIFSFFGTSFIKACQDLGLEVPDTVIEGKQQRGAFEKYGIAYVERYWWDEIQLLPQLAAELDTRLKRAGFHLRKWHGPGALADSVNRKYKTKHRMQKAGNPVVQQAAQTAYAGGRFEMFQLGRVSGPVWSYDINSAYPYGISQLPTLAGTRWIEHSPTDMGNLDRFGIYYIDSTTAGFDSGTIIGPAFHRARGGTVSYPARFKGWYWAPEAIGVLANNPHAKLVRGFRLDVCEPGTAFPWLTTMYEQRKQWKREGNSSQLALKLAMNSLYGKMAQQSGWNPGGPPPRWHQIEWAGWTTANCRAMIYAIATKMLPDQLIAIETDGIYSTASPEQLGITASDVLGGWEIDCYDEIIYLQSGLAWLRKGDHWTFKRRGVDPNSLTLADAQAYLQSLTPGGKWGPLLARTTRFVGMGAALASKSYEETHCVWKTTDREIRPGMEGKRVHIAESCPACMDGKTPWDAPHPLVVLPVRDLESAPYALPWEPNLVRDKQSSQLELFDE